MRTWHYIAEQLPVSSRAGSVCSEALDVMYGPIPSRPRTPLESGPIGSVGSGRIVNTAPRSARLPNRRSDVGALMDQRENNWCRILRSRAWSVGSEASEPHRKALRTRPETALACQQDLCCGPSASSPRHGRCIHRYSAPTGLDSSNAAFRCSLAEHIRRWGRFARADAARHT